GSGGVGEQLAAVADGDAPTGLHHSGADAAGADVDHEQLHRCVLLVPPAPGPAPAWASRLDRRPAPSIAPIVPATAARTARNTIWTGARESPRSSRPRIPITWTGTKQTTAASAPACAASWSTPCPAAKPAMAKATSRTRRVRLRS